jgi:hypothetical protein
MSSSCRAPTPRPTCAPALQVSWVGSRMRGVTGSIGPQEVQRCGDVPHLQSWLCSCNRLWRAGVWPSVCSTATPSVDYVHCDLIVCIKLDHLPSLQGAHVNELLEFQTDSRQLQQGDMGHLLASFVPEAAHLVKPSLPASRGPRPNVAPKALREESIWIVVVGPGWDGHIGRWWRCFGRSLKNWRSDTAG